MKRSHEAKRLQLNAIVTMAAACLSTTHECWLLHGSASALLIAVLVQASAQEGRPLDQLGKKWIFVPVVALEKLL